MADTPSSVLSSALPTNTCTWHRSPSGGPSATAVCFHDAPDVFGQQPTSLGRLFVWYECYRPPPSPQAACCTSCTCISTASGMATIWCQHLMQSFHIASTLNNRPPCPRKLCQMLPIPFLPCSCRGTTPSAAAPAPHSAGLSC